MTLLSLMGANQPVRIDMDSVQTVEASSLVLRLKNTAATVIVIALACAIYSVLPVHQLALSTLYGPPSISFTGYDFLRFAAIAYGIVLAIYFMIQPDPRVSKSLRFFRVLARSAQSPVESYRHGLGPEDRLAVLSTLLKSFFAPLMSVLLMRLCVGAWENGLHILDLGSRVSLRGLFDTYGFWFLFQVILFVDVFLFTAGYLVELPKLGNEIRSVDPTLVGWAAALACYPPFNSLSAIVIGSQASEFPQFDDPMVHIGLNVLILILMAGFASASVALGFKASNLTHRGIVARGPYALIRHPAYTFKNIAWWIGSIPAVSAAFELSTYDGIKSMASVVGVTMLYVLRALTEEDHLRGVDGDYAEYAAKVRYRFVPGLI
jgi:protein-S-isoprenylcysteine O-methyltransferase Ste14